MKTFYRELAVTPIFGEHKNLTSYNCSEFSFPKTVEERKFFPNYPDIFTSTS